MNEWLEKAATSLAALHKEEEDLKYALEKILEVPENTTEFSDIIQIDKVYQVRRTCSNCKKFFYLEGSGYDYEYCPFCGKKIGKIIKVGNISSVNNITPRILSLEEVFNTPENEVIWLEYHNQSILEPVYNPVKDITTYDIDHDVPSLCFRNTSFLILDDYKRLWRCWNIYVNEKEREIAPWEK